MGSVDFTEMLGLHVVRLKIGVVDRPGRRDATVMSDLTEVLRTQPEQGSTVIEFPDVVVERGKVVSAPTKP